jgi:hypothetical protein
MDEIIVCIPRERPFGAVAALVLGGVAARHELTLDVLDDLQLALETLLEREAESEEEISVELRVAPGDVGASVGPFARETVAELEEETNNTLGLRRLLTTVVDRVRLEERVTGCWVELHKSFEAAPAEVG